MTHRPETEEARIWSGQVQLGILDGRLCMGEAERAALIVFLVNRADGLLGLWEAAREVDGYRHHDRMPRDVANRLHLVVARLEGP